MKEVFSMDSVPEVIYDRHPEFLELYQKAWELASAHILTIPGLPAEKHMDEGFAHDRLWIWDTCFMVHYCKYSPDVFPGIQSLDNFYMPMHDGFESSCLIQHPDNPPLFAWVEYEYYRFTGDKSRILRNLVEKKYLQKHYEFIENCKIGERYPHSFLLNSLQKNECGYLWSGIASGMDNTPRGNDIYTNIYWIDILAQQALSALCISKMSKVIDENVIAEEYLEKYNEKKNLLNQYYYDDVDGSYYDIHAATHDAARTLTPASFWPLLAEVADEEQAGSQIKTLLDPKLLGGKVPAPSVARNSIHFCDDGRYWRGGVWMPNSYMVAKSLEKYGYLDVAADFAEKTLNHMSETYQKFFPATIWEAYSPSTPEPAKGKWPGGMSRPDFCGWSALGPISMLIENILGIYHVDAANKRIKYHYRNIGRHGVKNLRFADVCCDIVADNGSLTVSTNQPLHIEIDGVEHSCSSGKTNIAL